MKATGIVRRIDDLGRIVIPKEIRRTLRIKEGDPLEIFTYKRATVVCGRICRHSAKNLVYARFYLRQRRNNCRIRRI